MQKAGKVILGELTFHIWNSNFIWKIVQLHQIKSVNNAIFYPSGFLQFGLVWQLLSRQVRKCMQRRRREQRERVRDETENEIGQIRLPDWAISYRLHHLAGSWQHLPLWHRRCHTQTCRGRAVCARGCVRAHGRECERLCVWESVLK